jgi:dienelactone hydrolase
MRLRSVRGVALAFGLFWLAAASSPAAAQVEALFDLTAVETGPFPTNVFTRGDGTNLTNRRIDLPRVGCTLPENRARCAELDTLATLDGFNPQPRVRIPFDGDIDVSTVGSRTLFFVNLGDTASPTEVRGLGEVVGVNQVIFDPPSNTLFAESDALLRQHTRYALIATNGIRDTGGAPVRGSALARFLARTNFSRTELSAASYQRQLKLALEAARVDPSTVVSASVFTTQSTTAILEKIRRQIQSVVPAPARFDMWTTGRERAVFPLDNVASVVFDRQVGVAPTFETGPVAIQAFNVIPNSVGTIAFGTYASASFLTSDRVIPAVGTRTGTPQIQGFNVISFTLIVPAGPKPAAGWPIALFGHGFSGEKNNSVAIAASLAAQGIATISINVVGHGGGSLGSITVNRRTGAPVTFPSGGRGRDLNGDGNIDDTEGFSANGTIGSRDGLRQTVADLMQLVWTIRNGGVDVDGDGAGDFDPQRIFYTGISLGGIYGTMLLGVEPNLRAGVPNVPGAIQAEIARLSPGFRVLLGVGFSVRQPPLSNALPIAPPLFGFNENIPLRNLPPIVNDVPGAVPLMEAFDTIEWVTISGDPLGYARHIRAEPLADNQPKPLIFQFARGDMTVPNPTATALVRAGQFQDRVTFFRNDLFVQQQAAAGAPPATLNALRNPHGFLAAIVGVRAPTTLAAQAQIATFFASNGATTVDPDGPAPIFETPIVTLPEDLGFLPLIPVPPPAPVPAPAPAPGN